jgi:hypothetical protein
LRCPEKPGMTGMAGMTGMTGMIGMTGMGRDDGDVAQCEDLTREVVVYTETGHAFSRCVTTHHSPLKNAELNVSLYNR